MAIVYDKHYKTKNLFGDPYPELIAFFTTYPERGKLLDLGCGQGRDAIALARLGYEVTAIDHSSVGINQLIQKAKKENLKLNVVVIDLYQFHNFADYNFILLDNMFHFLKKDKKRETDLIKQIIVQAHKETIVVFCIQNTGNKVEILHETVDFQRIVNRITEQDFNYTYNDYSTGHSSTSSYKLIVVQL